GAAVLTPAARDALGVLWSGERHAPAEALLSFTHRPRGGPLWVKAGGGTGLTRGWGTPDLRLFMQLGWFAAGGPRRAEPGVWDRDGDGFGDAVDPCPDLAEDGAPDPGGDDGCPDLDTDGDRVPDGRDTCPRYPEDPDGFEDADGCPDPDNDGDAIPDDRDGHVDASGAVILRNGVGDCALAPETYNGVDDRDGCPDVGLAEVRGGEIVLLGPVYFATNQATLQAESMPTLAAVAGLLRAWPEIELVEVAGHADARGDDLSNLALSQARAAAVRDWLVAAGIGPERLVTRGYGESRPSITRADSASELALNRRVQIVILRARPGAPVTGYLGR
ncbi:MAG TPA: OmpA family protein, partial [Myxococcota bacterium]|nr:OmpA family protein [Myxococcota bacterium]